MNTKKFISNLGQWLLDAVFPIRCIECGLFAANDRRTYLCSTCLSKIPIKKSFECIGCKTATPLGATCSNCLATNSIDRLLIAAPFTDKLLQKTIHTMKYEFVHSLNEPLFILANQYLTRSVVQKNYSPFATNPLVVPVPLHRYRQNWRGFNQSALLARNLSNTFQMPYRPDVLQRISMNKPQADIHHRNERITNMKGVFACPVPESVKGKTILLVDDVCTTGATLNECARILKSHGALSVTALVIARG